MHPIVAPFASRCASRAAADTLYLVASLYALHPDPGGRGTLGDAMRRVWLSRGQTEAIEKRFVHVLDSHRDDLPGRLRQAISLCRSESVPIDWTQLARDLIGWDHEAGFAQRRWSMQFWGEQSEPRPRQVVAEGESTPRPAASEASV
jgi:CRISPR system Cascade subunit CasB